MPRGWLVIATGLMICANLLAASMDWHLLYTSILAGTLSVPRDFASFMGSAVVAAHLRAGHPLPHDFLPYPPPFLVLTTPFSWLRPGWDYLAWVVAGNAALILAARAAKLPWAAILVTLVSPADLLGLLGGQSGTFISAALLAALGLLEVQPIVAGLAAGCVIMKPQFALLLPVVFLAARSWHGIAAVAGSAAALCLLPTLIFGMGVWQLFFGHHVGAAVTLASGEWPQVYQMMMVTVYMTCRSLHAGIGLASAVQAVASLAAICAAWWLWQPGRRVDHLARLAATLCLVMLATPYAYVYDLPALCAATAACAMTGRPGGLAAMTLLWVATAIYCLVSVFAFLIGAFVFAGVLALVWPRRMRFEAML
jgi:hypothetical protein